MKDWHIKALWIDWFILKLIEWGFLILGWWLLSDCVSYIGHGIYTVIVWHWSCSPFSLSAAVQLLSFVIFSCLTHKHTHTTATKWLKWCLLKWHCDPRDVCSFELKLIILHSDLFTSASFTRVTETSSQVFVFPLSGLLFFYLFPMPKQTENVFNHACVRHVR